MKQSPHVIYSQVNVQLLKKKGQNALAKKETAYWICQILPQGVLVKPASDINVVAK